MEGWDVDNSSLHLNEALQHDGSHGGHEHGEEEEEDDPFGQKALISPHALQVPNTHTAYTQHAWACADINGTSLARCVPTVRNITTTCCPCCPVPRAVSDSCVCRRVGVHSQPAARQQHLLYPWRCPCPTVTPVLNPPSCPAAANPVSCGYRMEVTAHVLCRHHRDVLPQ